MSKFTINNATKIIKSAVEELERIGSGSTQATGAAGIPGTSGTSGIVPTSTENIQARTQENFRRAFPGLFGRSQKRSPTSYVDVKVSGKKGRNSAPFFQPKETWTHTFFLLGCVSDDVTPPKDELDDLHKAGLGKKKIVFPNKKADHHNFISILEKGFPKLKDGGGVELLCALGGGGGQRKLAVIPPGQQGYTIPYLRESICIGQATIYLRPLQQDLDLSPVISEYSGDAGPTLVCITCGDNVKYGHMKNHRENDCIQSCSKDNVNSIQDKDGGETKDAVASMKENNGKGTVLERICAFCGSKTEELHSAGVHEAKSGCIRVYSDDEEFLCGTCGSEQFLFEGLSIDSLDLLLTQTQASSLSSSTVQASGLSTSTAQASGLSTDTTAQASGISTDTTAQASGLSTDTTAQASGLSTDTTAQASGLSPEDKHENIQVPEFDSEVSFLKSAVVHRSNIRKDVIKLFSDPCIMMCHLDLVVLNERGEPENGKGKGVLLDVLTEFWQEFFMGCAVGASEKTPFIRHDLQKPQWESIARILVYGYKHVKYFPLRLSKLFITSCLFGDQSISPEFLLQSFRDYIPFDDREVLNRCLGDDFNSADEDILEFLGSFRCFRSPTKNTISAIVLELAHQELIQKPRYILNCWAPIVSSLKSDECFRTLSGINGLYDGKQTAVKKIVKLFKAEPSSDAERQSFAHLKSFVKSLEGKSLQRFLHFCTGSDVITCDAIDIQFSQFDGFKRRPVAHTCGPMLELPSTYESHPELAEEFTNIMKEEVAWSFDMV